MAAMGWNGLLAGALEPLVAARKWRARLEL
jgi:hypothetical protein